MARHTMEEVDDERMMDTVVRAQRTKAPRTALYPRSMGARPGANSPRSQWQTSASCAPIAGRDFGRLACLCWLFFVAACASTEPFPTGAGPADDSANSCQTTITAVPDTVVSTYGLDTTYYRQYCAAYGVPILASEKAAPEVLREAGRLASAVLGGAAKEVRDAIHDRYLHIIVTADIAGERFEDVPGLDDLYAEEAAAAGLGPTPDFPAVVVRDSVIMCRPRLDRPYATPPGDTLVHELGHALLSMGLLPLQRNAYGAHVLAAYEGALVNDTWMRDIPAQVSATFSGELPRENYMMTNPEEYFATGVSSYVGFKGITVGYGLRRISQDLATLSEERIVGPTAITGRDPALSALLEEALPTLVAPEHQCPAWLASY